MDRKIAEIILHLRKGHKGRKRGCNMCPRQPLGCLRLLAVPLRHKHMAVILLLKIDILMSQRGGVGVVEYVYGSCSV
jgi:hypothetical protein